MDTIIDFLRHGEPVGGRMYRGHTVDDELSEKGWKQMRNSIREPVSWDSIVSSPLKRCRYFAESVAEKYNLPVEIDDRFKEVGFGLWEGRNPDQILSDFPDQYHSFYADPVHNRPEGAESLDGFGDRVVAAYESVIEQYTGKHILVVAHAGVIRATMGYVMQAPAEAWYRVKVNNGALTRFCHGRNGHQLVFHNLIR